MRDVILESSHLHAMDVTEGSTTRSPETDTSDVSMKEWRNLTARNAMSTSKPRPVLLVTRGSVENSSRKYLMMMRLRRRM